MNISSSKRLRVASRHLPRFPLGQKRREYVQEALVKETVLNDEVVGLNKEGALCWKRCLLYHGFLDSAIPPFSASLGLFAIKFMIISLKISLYVHSGIKGKQKRRKTSYSLSQKTVVK